MSKGLAALLLVMSLALSSCVGFCGARSGKHWRQNRGPSTTMFRWKGKGKGKSGASRSHRQYGRGRQSPAMPAPPSPGGGNGYASPSPPSPSMPPQAPSVPPSPPPPLPPSLPPPEEPSQGAVFSVVAFGARGDGVTDDTQVTKQPSALPPKNTLLPSKGHLHKKFKLVYCRDMLWPN